MLCKSFIIEIEYVGAYHFGHSLNNQFVWFT